MSNIQKSTFLIGYKIFFALLGLGALLTEAVVLLERGLFNAVNFFSFFTVEINLLASITLIASAIMTAAGNGARLAVLRSAVTVYIIIVGIVFSLLLAGLENVALTAVPWDNTVLHYIMPAAVVIDFFLDRPRALISFKQGLVWLLVPLGYFAYSLIRGAVVGWYPYPFLNPSTNGYGSIAIAATGILALSLTLVWLVCMYARSGLKTAQKISS